MEKEKTKEYIADKSEIPDCKKLCSCQKLHQNVHTHTFV